MNVPAHLIFGAAAFGKPGQKRVTLGAVLGSFAPDLSLFVMAGWSLFITGINPDIVFGQYYFSEAWQRVFSIDNSFVFWGIGLGAALWFKRPALVAIAGSGLLHLVFDFALHNSDARIQFWPLSDWAFFSPFSYWDVRYYGTIIGPIEIGVTLMLAVLLLLRFRRLSARCLIFVAAAAELMTTNIFGMIFSH